MRHYKNLEMWEERKNRDYHKKLKTEAEARAKRWTEQRHQFGIMHPYLIIVISAIALATPLVLTVLFWSMMAD